MRGFRREGEEVIRKRKRPSGVFCYTHHTNLPPILREMLRGSYLLRLAARQPRALTALRVMSTASLAPKEALTSRGKDLTLKIKKIQALEAKRGELQRMLDEDDFPKWVRAHIDEVNRQLASKGEEPLGESVGGTPQGHAQCS